jgi:hypothetical protein
VCGRDSGPRIPDTRGPLTRIPDTQRSNAERCRPIPAGYPNCRVFEGGPSRNPPKFGPPQFWSGIRYPRKRSLHGYPPDTRFRIPAGYPEIRPPKGGQTSQIRRIWDLLVATCEVDGLRACVRLPWKRGVQSLRRKLLAVGNGPRGAARIPGPLERFRIPGIRFCSDTRTCHKIGYPIPDFKK